ncbi:acylphosphatase [Verrucomicrobiaceae bacterium N1E253]|uniref:acylphosphatase n=1 Tax=Oceaniferula marina TaxID=2748318 RepID=A0A851GP83_9BACT|nr:acylphosphatase [Oceaniferula marina]NWK56640.1 acylphosphatase [Oceaniferula marina]
MIAKRAYFEGRVQGVGFRYSVKQLAMGFDVTGWVKNLSDGRVELQVMGEEEEVDEFLEELAEESTMARNISQMHAEEIPLLENVSGFRIVS